jgi:hypothetical protein
MAEIAKLGNPWDIWKPARTTDPNLGQLRGGFCCFFAISNLVKPYKIVD